MMTYIDKQLSDSVLTVGERYMDKVHGGIVSVIKSYSQCFETFPFVASSARLILRDKLRYDLGGLFVMGWRLLWDRKIRIVHVVGAFIHTLQVEAPGNGHRAIGKGTFFINVTIFVTAINGVIKLHRSQTVRKKVVIGTAWEMGINNHLTFLINKTYFSIF